MGNLWQMRGRFLDSLGGRLLSTAKLGDNVLTSVRPSVCLSVCHVRVCQRLLAELLTV